MSGESSNRPRDASPCRLVHVGVGIIVRRGDLVLLGKRRGSHGAGSWALPGGKPDFGETVQQAAARELEEEAAIRAKPDRFRQMPFITNDVFVEEQRHFITLYVEMTLYYGDGEPQLMEPTKCDAWEWFSTAPSPMFLPLRNLQASGIDLWERC